MPSGEEIFTAELVLIERIIAFVCRRHHLTAEDAEDFASHARLKLMEDRYAILGKYEGRSGLNTFLSITLQRIFLDYRNAAWGKWRPSAEAMRHGTTGVLLDQLLTRDGYTFEQACEIISTNHRVSVPRLQLERIAAALPVRPRRRFESDDALVNVPSREATADVSVTLEKREAAARVAAALQQTLASLPAQDRLILRLRFEDGRTIAEIAAMLRLEAKPLYRRVERLLRDLRGALEHRGVSAQDAIEVLGAMTVDAPDDAQGRETEPRRPSIARGADAWP